MSNATAKAAACIEKTLSRLGFASVSVTAGEFDRFLLEHVDGSDIREDVRIKCEILLANEFKGVKFLWLA